MIPSICIFKFPSRPLKSKSTINSLLANQVETDVKDIFYIISKTEFPNETLKMYFQHFFVPNSQCELLNRTCEIFRVVFSLQLLIVFDFCQSIQSLLGQHRSWCMLRSQHCWMRKLVVWQLGNMIVTTVDMLVKYFWMSWGFFNPISCN